ncbi:MAG: FGGY family carbohydrate kinase [Candidatus Goldbacteria bacterium]|nr:FGGY family carbohydrate kinase [Candidatus Goldiibacteriota bacterium]
MYLLGYDVGSSSIKASLIEVQTGKLIDSASSPEKEMEILAKEPGWAEQHPEMWWRHLILATAKIKKKNSKYLKDVKAIGISYQMHGLVLIDKNKNVLRPSIIWCDSRAVSIGEKATKKIGLKRCLKHILNFPGNFTASKLRWVIENEPSIYKKVYKFILPGEYIAMKMTDKIFTTIPGLAEEMLWDYENKSISKDVLKAMKISDDLIPNIEPTFSIHGELTKNAADELGLNSGIKISYIAGDQPNNAFSLNVLNPGEVAATAGTSGVIFAIIDKNLYDPLCRVNTFAHVNYSKDMIRNGVMVCINGTGILNSWLKHNTGDGLEYDEMNEMAAKVNPGSDGLFIFPYGNGAERTLQNKNIGASIHNLNFNIHKRQHLYRAAQEGIVFALNYGFEVMKNMGVKIKKIRAGYANMFLSPVFRQIFANTCNVPLELYSTDGSQGAARAAGVGAGIYKKYSDAFVGLKKIKTEIPEKSMVKIYVEIYNCWKEKLINNSK